MISNNSKNKYLANRMNSLLLAVVSPLLLSGLLLDKAASAFSATAPISRVQDADLIQRENHHQRRRRLVSPLHALTTDSSKDSDEKTIKAANFPDEKPLISLEGEETADNADDKGGEDAVAATGTVNERLMAELQQAADKEKYGPKTSAGKTLGSLSGRPRKTPEEQEAALAEARNLNGVNPVVALGGGLFAFAVAAGLWFATNQLGSFFALHPVETDVYFVQRLASVFRNVVMGLASLASGFFGVTGMGIFLLGVRVAIGVAKGELDPTPIKKKNQDADLEMPNVWDLMMNKKPNRRGGRGGGSGGSDGDNLFGL